MKKRSDWAWVGAIWVALTVVLGYVVLRWSMMPTRFSREAVIIDEAYDLLMLLAVPVFAAIVALVGYSVVRFRTSGAPDTDGPPQHGSKKVIGGWLVVTTLLATGILINPGFVGLAEIRGEATADMVIHMEAKRFVWTATYPDGQVTKEELVLPVDTRIRFDIDSIDVLHSFWIPAFRTKIDAVPGRTTQLYVTTTRTGSLDSDPTMRIQCAELCGAGHANMAMPVRVVPIAEYETWIETVESIANGDGT